MRPPAGTKKRESATRLIPLYLVEDYSRSARFFRRLARAWDIIRRPMDLAQATQALAGIACLVALSWALSEQRAGVRWRVVLAGLALQAVLAALLLLVPWLREAVFSLNGALAVLGRATQEGTRFVFGFLGGGPPPLDPTPPPAAYLLPFPAPPLVLVV